MRFHANDRPSNKPTDQKLRAAFEEATAMSWETTDLDRLRQSVGTRLARNRRKDIPLMANIVRTLSTRRRLGIGLATAVAVLAFLTLVPFPYEIVVGYNLAYADLDPSVQLDTDAYVAGLAEFGYSNVSVSWNQFGDKLSYKVTGLPSEQAAENAAAVFATMTGVDATPGIQPVRKTVSGSLCAQAFEHMFRVEVTTDGKTQEEIIAEIKAKLAAQGAENSDVIITTDDDGNMQMQIEIEPADGE
jgi:hypothetical protein